MGHPAMPVSQANPTPERQVNNIDCNGNWLQVIYLLPFTETQAMIKYEGIQAKGYYHMYEYVAGDLMASLHSANYM